MTETTKVVAVGDEVIFHQRKYIISDTDAKTSTFIPKVPKDEEKQRVTCATVDLIWEDSLEAWYLPGRLFGGN